MTGALIDSVGLKGVRWRLLATILLATFFGFCASANAYIYFAGQERIGRARNDGSMVEPEFIHVEGFSCGVAVDAHHIYWANVQVPSLGYATIGRANLDGSGVEQHFIPLPVSADPCGIAVDSTHIYWTDMAGDIGKADLNGEHLELSWVTASEPCGLAVDGEFLYYAHGGYGINELALSGPSEGSVIASHPTTGRCGVAVDSQYVYWANGGPSSTSDWIGRAEKEFRGSPSDEWFYTGPTSPPWSVALHGGELFWAPYYGPIGRYKADGSEPAEPSFIESGGDVVGIAADDLPLPSPAPEPTGSGPPPSQPPPSQPPSNQVRVGKPLPRKNGTAALTVTIAGPGVLTLKGKGVVAVRKRIGKGGKLELTVTPTAKARGTLLKAGRLTVKVEITFTPMGGSPRTESKSVTLKA